jgi:hypothetical protein
MTAPPHDLEPGLADVMREVRDVIRNLEAHGAPGVRGPLQGAVARCNASLEHCLETERERRDREASVNTAKEELKRLAVLLAKVEPADAVIVMRQMRRVLARFDTV